ncbi:MAG: ABC transporter substrate-binding protein [Anaerolineae bacterium]|nr:ABC transporter substrate-binding protein [Anaerolineae bacterium]
MKRTFMALAVMALMVIVFAVPVAAQETACEAGFHLFDHEYLLTDPVCIPDDPQRVIALDLAALELLLYTDIEVAGATQWILDEMTASLPPLSDELAAITDLGYPVNTEKVLEVQPDLVLAYDGGDNVIDYDAVSQIAPVVVTSLAVEDWERTTQFWSEVLGVEDVFEVMKAEYDARIAELQGALEVDPAETEVSLVTAMSYGLLLWMSDSPQGKILEDVGFARPETQVLNPEGTYWLPISEERLDMADGDIAFLFAYATTDPETAAEEQRVIAEFQAGPLWQSLDVVQAGQVHVMDGYWYRAATYLIANRIIDDLFARLTNAAPETTYLDLLPGSAGELAAVSCEAGLRAIVDAAGAGQCIPEDPQRIVGLMEADVDALLALGIMPVGSTNGRGQETPPRYLDEYLGDVTSVGRFYSPNLEVLLELEPDLILFGGFTDEAVLEQLNAIAPTVNTFQTGEPWQSHFLRVAEILDREAEAQAFIADYSARIEALRQALGDGAEASFIVARWSAEGPQIMAPTLTFSSGVLLDLGLTAAPEIPELQEGHPHSAPLSLESLELLDVDWAFIGTLSPAGDAVTALEEALASPLFQTLDVVQNDRVVLVDGSLWTSVGGPLAAAMVLEDAAAALTGSE